jgi:hypothetical protein
VRLDAMGSSSGGGGVGWKNGCESESDDVTSCGTAVAAALGGRGHGERDEVGRE